MHEPGVSALTATPSSEEVAKLGDPGLTVAGHAALAVAEEFARHSASPVTLRAYRKN